MDKAPDAFRTISEVADDLKVPQHVLRFWESRFAQIKPMKRAGGRRYYRPDDVDLLRGIHHLLYGEGYTIRGVQRILRDQGIKFVQAVWQAGAAQPPRLSDDEVPEADDENDITETMFVVGEEHEATESMARPGPSATVSGSADLTRDDLRKLQVTLFELNECRRLLDDALKPN